MKAVVVYESLYGNTAAMAEAIARSLGEHALDVDVHPVTEVPEMETAEVELLVVGGPTHAHGMSRASTRAVGAGDEKNTFTDPTVDPGLREWLGALPDGAGRFGAAFDTRFDRSPVLTGSAAKGIAHRLEKQGFRLVAAPQSFFVTNENRLEDGQMERAASWGAALARLSRQTIAH
jgi:hypothetical protein